MVASLVLAVALANVYSALYALPGIRGWGVGYASSKFATSVTFGVFAAIVRAKPQRVLKMMMRMNTMPPGTFAAIIKDMRTRARLFVECQRHMQNPKAQRMKLSLMTLERSKTNGCERATGLAINMEVS